MPLKTIFLFITFSFYFFSFSQKVEEILPPFHIKSVTFLQGEVSCIPFFKLGDSFSFEFDDLYPESTDYYYTITHCSYSWIPSNLNKVEYINGMDNLRITNYSNSYNTLQSYSHYSLTFPNKNTQITKSGNYLLTIYNDDDELVFSRKFIVYEDVVSTILTIRRARDAKSLATKQNAEISIDYGNFTLQNPLENVKILLIKNGNFETAKKNIQPQYILGSKLLYKYNKATQFWGGNEFYTLNNEIIRGTNNSVARVTSGDGIYNTFLYTNTPRTNQIYTYFPDFNGNFFIKNDTTYDDVNIEADYSWVYFSLAIPELFSDDSIYINGMFNNYATTDEYKMSFNKKTNQYEAALFLKQGYTNYQYVRKKKNGTFNFEEAIDGNFYQTENTYTLLVYYKGTTDRYDRIIGRALTNSEFIRN